MDERTIWAVAVTAVGAGAAAAVAPTDWSVGVFAAAGVTMLPVAFGSRGVRARTAPVAAFWTVVAAVVAVRLLARTL